MSIAIDIGNSRIKAGSFENNKLSKIFSYLDIADILKFLRENPDNEIAVSSVVPEKIKIIDDEIKKLGGKKIFVISKELRTNLEISYKTPETLGTDRLCSAEGAFFLFKNSEKYKNYKPGNYILSIDFGTATTINVIEYPGNFIGGLIAPGLDMMFESLKQKTAQLPLLDISNFTTIIGDDTNSSISSGVVTSVVGMIEKTINHLVETRHAFSPQNIFIYVTGGNAQKIIPHLNFDFTYEEGLVLYGINALYGLNKNLSIPNS